MNKEGKILKTAIDLSDYKIDEVIEITGISRGVLYGLFDKDLIKKDYKEKIKNLNLDINFNTNSTEISGIPVYNVDFTASNITQFTDFQEKIIGYVDLDGFKKCVAFVKVKGNSMFPTFTAGDYVGLEPISDFSIIEYGQPFGITTKSGQNLIKIIRKGKDNDNLILRSNNKDFDDIDLHKKDIIKLYKAHGPIRDTHY